jgi:hypothetical protein
VSGENFAAPHIRPVARPTGARLVTLTRDGRLEGFGVRIEEPPLPLHVLPGAATTP